METVYINKEIYKSMEQDGRLYTDNYNVMSLYGYSNKDPIIEFNSTKLFKNKGFLESESLTKTYESLNYFRRLRSLDEDCTEDVSLLLDGVDWISVGKFKGFNNQKEFYFVVDTEDELQLIATHYNLNYPIPDGMEFETFKTSNFKGNYGVPNKMWGSVTFVDDIPTRLKAYLWTNNVSI